MYFVLCYKISVFSLIQALISKLTAVLMIFLIIVISTSIKVSTKILNILFAMKVLALVLIIVGGIYALFTKGTAGLSNSFEGNSCHTLG